MLILCSISKNNTRSRAIFKSLAVSYMSGKLSPLLQSLKIIKTLHKVSKKGQFRSNSLRFLNTLTPGCQFLTYRLPIVIAGKTSANIKPDNHIGLQLVFGAIDATKASQRDSFESQVSNEQIPFCVIVVRPQSWTHCCNTAVVM